MPSASVPPPSTAEVIPTEQVRDPDAWLSALCWATVIWSGLQILLFSFGRDQAIYATVAEGILHGAMPYRDVWDFKPPGIFAVYSLSFGLFGKSMMAPRLIEVAGLIAMVIGMRRLGAEFFGSRCAGLVGGALAALLHAQLEFWHTGQPESFAGFLTIGALVLTAVEIPRRLRHWAWAGVGALFGIAFLLKPPLGGGAVVCAAYLASKERARGAGARGVSTFVVVGLGSLFPIALCALWFAARGALGDLWWTLGEFAPGYTQLSWEGQSAPTMFYHAVEEAFFRFSALLGAGFIAAIVMRPLYDREREGFFLILGVVSVQLAGVAMQGKFFQYHYGATLPLIALISGAGLYKLWRRLAIGSASGTLAFLTFVVVVASMRDAVRDVPHGFWHRSLLRTGYLLRVGPISTREELDQELYYVADYSLTADRQVASELRSRADPTDRLYIWGFEPAIYWMSELQYASRFIYDVPQRAQWQRETARRLLLDDLKKDWPRWIVVQRRDVFPFVTGNRLDSADSLDDFTALSREIVDNYSLVTRIEDFDIYERIRSRPEKDSP